MTPHTHTEKAIAHLEAVTATRDHLKTLYGQTPTADRAAAISTAHQAIGVGLKMAHIHAELAIVDAITGTPTTRPGPCMNIAPARSPDTGPDTCTLDAHPGGHYSSATGSTWKWEA